MKLRLKKILTVTLCVALAGYVVLAMTAFNHPKEAYPLCTKVVINIEDESTNGFLSAAEIRRILERNRLYPFKKRMKDVNPRDIEDKLKDSPFVKTAQCYKAKDGCVSISITQRLPIIRVKNVAGEDYYLDDHGGIMPNSNYTSDLIIATGYISKWYARNYLSFLAMQIMGDDFWRNQVVRAPRGRPCRLLRCPPADEIRQSAQGLGVRLRGEEARQAREVLQVWPQPGGMEQVFVHRP